MKKPGAKWFVVLSAAPLAALLLSTTAADVVAPGNARGAAFTAATFDGRIVPQAVPWPSPAGVRPELAPTTVTTPAPTVAPPPTPARTQSPPERGFCADTLSVNVIDPELTVEVQAGAGLLAEYFGCQKFRLDGSGVPIKFGPITALFNAKVLGYAYSAPGAFEIWLNRDCWGVLESWAEVVAHELGHYLGWRHGDGHPYIWLTPPAGSYAIPGDGKLVC